MQQQQQQQFAPGRYRPRGGYPQSGFDIEGNVPGGERIGQMPPYIRAGFIQKVYGILTMQMLLTTSIVLSFMLFVDRPWIVQHIGLYYLCQSAALGMVIGMACRCRGLRTYPTNYIFLMMFTVVMSVMLGFVCSMYSAPSVAMAAGITTVIFAGLSTYAFFTKTAFTGLGPYLFGGCLCLMITGFLLMLFPAYPLIHKVYAGLGALLFCFYIIYDTQLVAGGAHSKYQFGVDEYCFAALNLYLDIVNLFLYILSLIGDRDR